MCEGENAYGLCRILDNLSSPVRNNTRDQSGTRLLVSRVCVLPPDASSTTTDFSMARKALEAPGKLYLKATVARLSFTPSPLEAKGNHCGRLGTKEISKEVAEGTHCRGKLPFSVR